MSSETYFEDHCRDIFRVTFVFIYLHRWMVFYKNSDTRASDVLLSRVFIVLFLRGERNLAGGTPRADLITQRENVPGRGERL